MRRVAIKIQRQDGGFTATVTPPHGAIPWSTSAPMTVEALIAKLRELGCHQTDIGDAFYEADPRWLEPR
jgi:hypothetical protein